MTLRKRGKWYHVDIGYKYAPSGRIRFSTRPANHEQAMRIHNDVERQILDSRFDVDSLKPIVDYSLSELKDRHQAERKHDLSENTSEIYHYAFQWFERFLEEKGLSEMPIRFLRRETVRDFKFWCVDTHGHSKTYYNMRHRSLRASFNWAKKELGAVRVNPFNDVSEYDVADEYRRDATPDDLKKVLPVITDSSFRDYVMFLYISGLRRSEGINLTWDDVDFERRFFVIRGSTAKSKKFRVIPMSDLHHSILEKRAHLPRPFGYKPKSASSRFSRAAKKAGVDISLHSLRHGTTTILFESNEHPLKVKSLLGHSDLKTTLLYAHQQPGYVKSAVEVMGKVGEDILEALGD